MGKLLLKDKKQEMLYERCTFCNDCGRFIPVEILKIDGYIHTHSKCPYDNKENTRLLFKGENFPTLNVYENSLPKYFPHCTADVSFGDQGTYNDIVDFQIHNLSNISYILLYYTQKCNSNCSICVDRFADPRGEMKLTSIYNYLKPFNKKMVYIFGGEPTVRGDLEDTISLIAKTNNYPVLFTNGIRLSDKNYLEKLKSRGLNFVNFSLDSVDFSTYLKVRNLPEPFLDMKLTALRNLKEEGLKVGIETTLIRGINGKDNLKKLLQFGVRNSHIWDWTFRGLDLGGKKEWAGFNRDHLLSTEEIEIKLCQALGIEEDYFNLWDEFKLLLASNLSKIPLVRLPSLNMGAVYFYRNKNSFKPLLAREELIELISSLKGKKLNRLFNTNGRKLFNIYMKSLLKGRPIEIEFTPGAIVRFRVTQLIPPYAIKFKKGDYVNGLIYYPGGKMVVANGPFAQDTAHYGP